GEAVRLLPVGDRPGFVKPVDERAIVERRLPLEEPAAHAEVPVGGRHDGFVLGEELGGEDFLDEAPVIDGVDEFGGQDGIVLDHGRSNVGTGSTTRSAKRCSYFLTAASSSARSFTTTSAPFWRSASPSPWRSMPMTSANPPARPD